MTVMNTPWFSYVYFLVVRNVGHTVQTRAHCQEINKLTEVGVKAEATNITCSCISLLACSGYKLVAYIKKLPHRDQFLSA